MDIFCCIGHTCSYGSPGCVPQAHLDEQNSGRSGSSRHGQYLVDGRIGVLVCERLWYRSHRQRGERRHCDSRALLRGRKVCRIVNSSSGRFPSDAGEVNFLWRTPRNRCRSQRSVYRDRAPLIASRRRKTGYNLRSRNAAWSADDP